MRGRPDGTELEVGYDVVSATDSFVGSGGGNTPPERNDGQSERSSGRDEPPDADGVKCERIAAASISCTCWCLLSNNFDASRQCGVCSQRCLIKHDGWRYTFEQLSHVKIVPRFFPFFVAPPVTPALESARGGGVPEMLNPSSTGTELLIPFLAAGVLNIGIVTGPVGARAKVEETSRPGGDTDEDMDNDARELRVVVAVCKTTGDGRFAASRASLSRRRT